MDRQRANEHPTADPPPDQAEAVDVAREHGLDHRYDGHELIRQWSVYPFGTGAWRRARNVVHGAIGGRSIAAFEYHYLLLSDDTTQRQARHEFLVGVVDLPLPVPPLCAVCLETLRWHDGEFEGEPIEVDHRPWQRRYALVGPDREFARRVLPRPLAERCGKATLQVEWRFTGNQFLFWVENGRVGEQLIDALQLVDPLVAAAEDFARTSRSEDGRR